MEQDLGPSRVYGYRGADVQSGRAEGTCRVALSGRESYRGAISVEVSVSPVTYLGNRHNRRGELNCPRLVSATISLFGAGSFSARGIVKSDLARFSKISDIVPNLAPA